MSTLMTVKEMRKLSVEELACGGWRLEDEAVELYARAHDLDRRARWIQILLASKIGGIAERAALKAIS